jgi:hypothetical protein
VDPVIARIPKAARPNTQEGAEAFAKFFIEQMAETGVQASTTPIEDLFADSCKACLAVRDSATKLAADGARHERPALVVEGVSAYTFQADSVVIAVQATQRQVKVLDKLDSVIRITKPDKGTFALTLDYDGHWVVLRSQIEQKY